MELAKLRWYLDSRLKSGMGASFFHAALESLAVSSMAVNDLTDKYARRMCLGR